jgi:lycopene beta-cyclase
MTDHDVVFAGGGLASTLAACRLKARRPELRLLIVEAGQRLGGNHTWSCHATDLTAEQNGWMAPFIAHRWPGQMVRFPKFTRTLRTPYQSITAQRLHDAALAQLDGAVRLNTRIAALDRTSLSLENGERLTAACVFDGRGAAPSRALALAFQKFVGLEVRLAAPHGETVPVIMDATVSQTDGYRFVYTLPFSTDTILIEDTYYADGPDLEPDRLRARIEAYAASRGWQIAEILREETGTLPILLGGDIDAFWRESGVGAARIGLRAVLFHPTTGYSLPDAVAMADALADLRVMTSEGADGLIRLCSKQRWQERSFYRMLNRMLFLAAEPDRRYEVLQRFYQLPEPLIARFYRAASTYADKARILIGRPPVPIIKALTHIRNANLKPGRFGDAGQQNG